MQNDADTVRTTASAILEPTRLEPLTLLPHRLDYIDALRGLACLGVIMYHNFGAMDTNSAISEIMQQHPSPLIAVLRVASSIGWVGVPLFLCLSGFCLFLPVLRRYPLASVQVNFAGFMQRRAKRILPTYYLAAALLMCLEILPVLHIVPAYLVDTQIGGLRSVLMHAFLIHNFNAATIGEINPSFWSMAIEWQLYLAFPIFLWLVRRGGVGLLMGTTLIVAVVWNLFASTHLSDQKTWQVHFMWLRNPLSYAWFFSLGMTAAVLVADSQLSTARYWVMSAGCFAFPVAAYGATHPLPGAAEDICWGLFFAGLIVALSYMKHSYFEGINPLAALKGLGIFSYSVYLIHYPLLQSLHHCHLGRLVYLVGPPLAIAVGYLFFLSAEKPFLKRARSPAVSPAI